MIRISRKADNAIFLLTALARTEEKVRSELAVMSHGRSPGGSEGLTLRRDAVPLMSAAELAGLSGISRFIVANLLKEFARAGVLVAVRGAHGGYRLAQPPERLSLRDILAVVDGPLLFVACADLVSSHHGEQAEDLCGVTTVCPAKGPLAVLHNRILTLLESLPLSELAYSETNPFTSSCGLEFKSTHAI